MSPIDDQLRATLRERAGSVTPGPDALAGIERRARGIRRRRMAGAAGGVAAAVAAVAVAVPLAVSGGAPAHHRGGYAGTPSPGASPAATAPATAQPSSAPSAAMSSVPSATATLDAQRPLNWTYHGLNTWADGATRMEIGKLVHTQLATRWKAVDVAIPEPLWGGDLGDGRAAVLFVAAVHAADGEHVVAGAWVKDTGPATVEDLHDIAVGRDGEGATQVSAVVAGLGGTPGWVLVAGAPGTGAVTYAAPGSDRFTPVEQLPGYHGSAQEGWAVFERAATPAAGSPVDRIAVYAGGDGVLRYQGPIGRGLTFPDV